MSDPKMIRVRKATEGDLPDLSRALAAAFHDDPVFSWWIPDAARRRQITLRFFETITEANLAHHEIYTTDDVVAGAVWVPPGAEDDDEQLASALGEASGEYAQKMFEISELLAEQHPQDEPHYYLFFLGTMPQWQSQGIGSALMRPVLEMCDRDGVPAYLEATTERNKPLYVRNGFELIGEIQLPDGPSVWPMWRAPK